MKLEIKACAIREGILDNTADVLILQLEGNSRTLKVTI